MYAGQTFYHSAIACECVRLWMISVGTSPSVSHPEGNTQMMMQTEPLGSGGSGSV